MDESEVESEKLMLIYGHKCQNHTGQQINMIVGGKKRLNVWSFIKIRIKKKSFYVSVQLTEVKPLKLSHFREIFHIFILLSAYNFLPFNKIDLFFSFFFSVASPRRWVVRTLFSKSLQGHGHWPDCSSQFLKYIAEELLNNVFVAMNEVTCTVRMPSLQYRREG